ncbi:cytochrome c oxidase subunit II [Alkalihalobacillus sp. TS-13]|uniref:cytochrome c oxidase subunit II n=1 Tax=Alkalihalobacillus sp. TS-13 TaxID=2842455 RepID=UPI001C87C035|nr:cytochrome c oxidase subunit II [Alkalihalobacillus sp. TS-13]
MKKAINSIATLFLLFMTGCSPEKWDVLDPKSSTAETQLSLIHLSIALMSIVLITVTVLFTFFLVKYRKRPGWQTETKNQKPGDKKLEITWTLIPILILVILAVPTVLDTYKLDQETKASDGALVVKVTAHQFWWEFEYPEEGVTASETLHVPVDKKVIIELTSADTIHSFWVPQLGGKQDANPGRKNRLSFTPNETGVYRGSCAELCGRGHAYMRFHVKVETESEFDSWIEGMKQPEQANLTDSEEKGQEIFKNQCLSCHGTQGLDPKVSGSPAPHLGDFASQKRIANVLPNNRENLKKWLNEPQKVKPGAKMPSFKKDFTDEEKDELIDYLMSLKVKEGEK